MVLNGSKDEQEKLQKTMEERRVKAKTGKVVLLVSFLHCLASRTYFFFGNHFTRTQDVRFHFENAVSSGGLILWNWSVVCLCVACSEIFIHFVMLTKFLTLLEMVLS